MGSDENQVGDKTKKYSIKNSKSRRYQIMYKKYLNQNAGASKEASVEEASVEEASVEEASVEEALVEEAQVEEALIDESSSLSNWEHQEDDGPVKYYSTIVAKYGEPDVLANVPGGICIWYVKGKNSDPHEEIILRDEYVEHSKPKDHHDFLYSYVKIFIPKEKLWEVLSLSGSINYDPLKHLLFARCGSFNANFATIRTVFEEIEQEQEIEQKINYSDNIQKALGKNKNNVLKDNEDYVKRNVIENQKKYAIEIEKDYYDF